MKNKQENVPEVCDATNVCPLSLGPVSQELTRPLFVKVRVFRFCEVNWQKIALDDVSVTRYL